MDAILKLFNQEKLVNLTQDEEKSIFKKINDKTRERIVYAHARLVVKICRKYEGCGLDLEDLVSEGLTGLHRAIELFNPKKGIKFSYYCSFWVKQRVIKALSNQGRLIRLPPGITWDFLNILKYRASCEAKGRKNPSNEETAKKLKIPLGRVRNINNATRDFVYLDSPVKDYSQEDIMFSSFIEDERAVLPFTSMAKENDLKVLSRCINKLNEREQLIIKNRFGLGDESEKTLQQLANRLKLSRERVRQIEEKTIWKLKEMFEEEEKIC